MSNAVWNPPAGRTVLEHIDHMLDKPVEIPAHRQPDFPVDHSRLPHLEYEREQLKRARTHSEHLELPALCIISQMKRADQFWRQVLASRLDALFFYYEGEPSND